MSDPQVTPEENHEDHHSNVVGVDPDFAVGINDPALESDDDDAEDDESVPGSDQR